MSYLFWQRFLLVMLLTILLILKPAIASSLQLGSSTPDRMAELRGVWLTNIDSDVLFSRRNLDRALRRLRSLNFNTIYPTVWNWGYTLYPSAIAEQVTGHRLDPHPGLQGRDSLAEAVSMGHRQGLAVIPWFEFGLMAPADSDLARRHPDWLTNRQDGSQIVMEGVHPRVWLNPIHPEVQQFMLDLITEIVSTYEVDGLQLDDHFGMPVELGYDAYTTQLYRQENSGRLPPSDPQDPDWKRWRANKITDLMSRVFYAVKAHRTNTILSLSPNPRDFSYDYYLQDWWAWERRGFVEELIVQIYRNDLNSFIAELERPELALVRTHIPLGVGILTGLRNRITPTQQIVDQVRAVRDRQLAGVSFFFYETLGNRDGSFRSLFPRRTRRPAIGAF